MTLDSLQLYCDIIRWKSFSRAAAEHGVSQSAASQAVQQIESELHVRLLDRSKRPFGVTPEGNKFYDAFRKMLETFKRTCSEFSTDTGELSGTVRVAAIYSVGLHGLSGPMERFSSLYPKVRVRLECLHPHQVVEAVTQDEADLGVLSFPPASRALTVVPLRQEATVFVCNPNHRLARKKTIEASDLIGEQFVAFDADLAIRKSTDRAMRKHNVRLDVAMEFDNVETIKQAIINGAGVGLLPAPTIMKEAALRTLTVVPFNMPELVRPIAAIHRHNKELTPAVMQFLEQLRLSEQPFPDVPRNGKAAAKRVNGE